MNKWVYGCCWPRHSAESRQDISIHGLGIVCPENSGFSTRQKQFILNHQCHGIFGAWNATISHFLCCVGRIFQYASGLLLKFARPSSKCWHHMTYDTNEPPLFIIVRECSAVQFSSLWASSGTFAGDIIWFSTLNALTTDDTVWRLALSQDRSGSSGN